MVAGLTPRSVGMSSRTFRSEESDKTFATNELPIENLTGLVYDRVFGANWHRKKHEVLSFRSDRYDLDNVDFLKDVPCSTLHTLDLAHNSIEDMTGVDQIAHQLRVLNLSHNKIFDFVMMFPRLEELHLDHNELEQLPPVSGLPRIRVLNLSHNRITKMKFDRIGELANLQDLDVSHNAWSCQPVRTFLWKHNLLVQESKYWK
eukprot:gene1296-272_t